jgi:phage baseplate assembly protein gpV
MAKQNRTTLKGYFETGDIPTGGNYVDLIDSPLILDTENTGSINILGTITASGNISSSGFVYGTVFDSQGYTIGNYDTGLGAVAIARNTNIPIFIGKGTPEVTIYGNITASGNISSSGIITAAEGIFGTGTTTINDSINTTGNITASGNISASGTISAFGSSSLVGLPTTEPLTPGALWLSGSGGGSASGSKYLMVFTG